MIHQLLNLTRPLIVFDTETTGTDVQNDRIVELAFQLWTPGGLQKEYRTLVNPLVPILNSVTGKHGITDEHVRSCRNCRSLASCACEGGFKPWPTFKQLAGNVAMGFTDCDYAGKNVRFDLRIMSAEFARVGVAWSIGDARIVDIDRLEALLNKRSLSHLYRKYTGRKLEGAHGAMADVQASTVVIEAQMHASVQNEDEATMLPRGLGELHALQFPGMIDLDGKFAFVDGVPCFTQWGKHAGKQMAHPDLFVVFRGETYYDFILKSDFSVEVKAIAAKAKIKQFPKVNADVK